MSTCQPRYPPKSVVSAMFPSSGVASVATLDRIPRNGLHPGPILPPPAGARDFPRRRPRALPRRGRGARRRASWRSATSTAISPGSRRSSRRPAFSTRRAPGRAARPCWSRSATSSTAARACEARSTSSWSSSRTAAKHGGRVVFLLGNHEVMNMTGDLRYVVPRTTPSSRTPDRRSAVPTPGCQVRDLRKRRARQLGSPEPPSGPEAREAWLQAHPPGFLEHQEAFGPGGDLWSLAALEARLLRRAGHRLSARRHRAGPRRDVARGDRPARARRPRGVRRRQQALRGSGADPALLRPWGDDARRSAKSSRR